jgi:hypothetical protein
MLETNAPLSGFFIGLASITENASSSEQQNVTDVSITFLDGEYTVTADGRAVQSSTGHYYMGHQLLFQHRTSELGPASERILSGYFEYRWASRLLVLEQWDAVRDRLVLVILERTAPAIALFPYATPDATIRTQPWPPRRPARTIPVEARTAADN